MFKLDLEKADKPEIKLPTSAGSSKKQESSRRTSISALLTMPKPLTVWITINCGKFWKRWNTRSPDLPLEKPVCRSKSNRSRHGTTDRFQIGKGICEDCILSLCLFNFYAEYIVCNDRLDESQAIIKNSRRNINNFRYAESEEELKSLLMRLVQRADSFTKTLMLGKIEGKWRRGREN